MKVRGTLEFSDDGRNWRPAHESEIAETMIFVKLRDGREVTFGGDNHRAPASHDAQRPLAQEQGMRDPDLLGQPTEVVERHSVAVIGFISEDGYRYMPGKIFEAFAKMYPERSAGWVPITLEHFMSQERT